MKFKVVALGLAILLGLFVITNLTTWLGGAAKVAQKEFSAEAMLKKYEWFKDASHQIEKRGKDIQIYTEKQTMCVGQIDRLAREQCMMWSQEVAGIKSAHNSLVAEYNAQSSKFNWSAFNADNIPVTYQER